MRPSPEDAARILHIVNLSMSTPSEIADITVTIIPHASYFSAHIYFGGFRSGEPADEAAEAYWDNLRKLYPLSELTRQVENALETRRAELAKERAGSAA